MNFLAIILGAALNMVIGFFWYSPKMFGRARMESLGKSEKEFEEIKKGANKAYAFSFLGALVMSLVLSALASLTQAEGVLDGVFIGIICWAGFIATTAFNSCLFSSKPVKQAAIDAGYYLAALIVMGVVISAWR